MIDRRQSHPSVVGTVVTRAVRCTHPCTCVYPDSMDDSIERVIEDLEEYSRASQRLIDRLEVQNQWHLADIEALRQGIPLSESSDATRSAERSRDLTRILDEFEQSRRRIRASVTAAALAEGMSAVRIGEMFGVSRQLAGRLVREARDLPPRIEPGGNIGQVLAGD